MCLGGDLTVGAAGEAVFGTELHRRRHLPAPFDDPEFLYEVKFDGFRALAYVEDGHCEFVSRKGHVYRRFADLCQSTFGLPYPTVGVVARALGARW